MEIKGRILLAEDDDHLRELVKDALEEEDYEVTDCMNGQEAINLFDKNKFDICLLDIMMPVKDGFTVAKKIRQQSDVIPILFISTKALIEDKVEGYQRGADDYIVKPFNMKELLLKLDVFLRRTKKMFSETKQEFDFGKIHFSFTDLRLSNDDGVFDLKQKEADLLKFLCEHPNRILKREEILIAVWGKNDYFLGRSMDVFMSKVRKYLRADPGVVLETIHGTGYRFTVPLD
ncbi:MAG TPA: response regulator transcription factor [Chitinophagaceae bacterium]|nr:response regulator transcription factor [Chitinophagaceae bacterium]